MANINLLPQEMGSNPKADKLVKKIKGYLVNELIILTLVVAAGLGAYFYYTNQVSLSEARVNDLKRQISSQESSEQKLMLIKDRVNKADSVLSKDATSTKIAQLELLLDIFPSGVSLNKADINEDRLEVELSAANTSSLVNFLSLVMNNGDYSRIDMVSLDYTNEKAFSITLDLFE
jgi:hypothetical protein